MLERDVILGKARALQSSNPAEERDPEEDEVWNGTGYKARFSLSRAGATICDLEVEQLQLTLRGLRVGQEALKVEFVRAFGYPEVEINARRFRYPRLLIWGIEVLEK